MQKFMLQSKKSSSKKPVFIFIYGPIAAGKLTIAKILSKKIGYKVFHNHLVIDLVSSMFERKDERRHLFRENLHLQAVKNLAKLRVSTILTHAYGHNFVFPSGLTDPNYVRNTEKAVVKNGGVFLGVHLVCDEKELLKRLKGKSRNLHMKLKDTKIMKENLRKYDHVTPAPLKHNIQIDNTKLSPSKVADMIIKHYKLKRG